jgi:hypothetical protein
MLTMPSICPSHGLPLDRRRAWAPTGDAFLCAACESALLEARARRPCLFPELPPNATPDDAMRLLVEAFSNPRL